jgi:hypothetical protein
LGQNLSFAGMASDLSTAACPKCVAAFPQQRHQQPQPKNYQLPQRQTDYLVGGIFTPPIIENPNHL